MYHINRLIRYHDRPQQGSSCSVGEELLSVCFASVVTDVEEDEVGHELDDGVTGLPTLDLISSSNSLDKVKINQGLTETQSKQIGAILTEFEDIITNVPGKAKVKKV